MTALPTPARPAPTPSPLQQALGGGAHRRWSPADTRQLARLLAVVLALHLVGWGVVAVSSSSGGGAVLTAGLGLTAYLYGVRHAFDADHIAVIDGATRKLTADGKRPLAVGFWFSLGHSSVVLAMAVVVALGVRSASALTQEGTPVHDALGAFGTSAAGVFLWIIGLVNLAALVGVLRVRRRLRRGHLTTADLEAHLAVRGVLARSLERITRRVTRPGQVYPVGLLMGLGFDTATEVALLVLAGTAATALPWYAVLALPVLFAAGMSLFDTLDGAFMTAAYDWAFTSPLRKLTYNTLVTGLSVVVCLVIGSIQLVSVAHEQLGWGDALTTRVAELDTSGVGIAVVGAFLLLWGVGALAQRVAGWRPRGPAAPPRGA